MGKLREDPPGRVGRFKVDTVSLMDGIKFYFENGSWMLMRVSQTEPLGRIYVASDSSSKVQKFLEQGVKLLTEK